MRVKENEIEAPIAKFLTDIEKKNLASKLNAHPGDLIFILTGPVLKLLILWDYYVSKWQGVWI